MGQLGLGDDMNRCSPTIIEYLTDKKVEKIYCNGCYTVAITQNGEVYSWGSNYNGNLGIGNNNNVDTPTKINFPNNIIIKKLYVGRYCVYAVDTLSKIYSWGSNYKYQLCNNNNMQPNLPSIANMLEDFNIEKIVCLIDSTIILADDKLYSIGYGRQGELGLDIIETNILNLIAEGVENAWGNARTVFCKMNNGDIYTWGINCDGELV